MLEVLGILQTLDRVVVDAPLVNDELGTSLLEANDELEETKSQNVAAHFAIVDVARELGPTSLEPAVTDAPTVGDDWEVAEVLATLPAPH